MRKQYRHPFNNHFIKLINNTIIKFLDYNNDEFNLYLESWFIDNKKIINNEEYRIKNNGYNGNFHIKLKNCIKYYRNKNIHKKTTNVKPINNIKIRFSNNISNLIKRHIHNYYNDKPSISYVLFVNNHNDLIVIEFNKYKNIDMKLLYDRLKKSYKNHYNNIHKKLNYN